MITNGVGVAAVLLAASFPDSCTWLDPVGAIVIAGWIMYSWAGTAMEQISKLAGITAPPEFLQRVTHLAFNHDDNVLKV